MSEIEIEQVGDIQRMPDGTEYRGVIQGDKDPLEPYDDGAWPILRVSYRHYDYVAEAFNSQADPYVDKFNELFERLRELRVWERYAKIFLGASRVEEYGFNRGTDYSYIAFDPTAWRDSMGWDSDDKAVELLADDDPLAEIRAWIEGDVWGVAAEARWNPDNKLEADEGWAENGDGWVWGHYTRKWAEQAAGESLKWSVEHHKTVHRYAEHEKIAAHQKEIDTILEFLESHTLQGHTAVRGGHQEMVFEHFGIDYQKIEQERELMVKRLQEEANDKPQ